MQRFKEEVKFWATVFGGIGGIACTAQLCGLKIEAGALALPASWVPSALGLGALLLYLVTLSGAVYFRGRQRKDERTIYELHGELLTLRRSLLVHETARSDLKIASATWGAAYPRPDVTAIINGKPRNAVMFYLNNDYFGIEDPAKGNDNKYVEIEYSFGGREVQKIKLTQRDWVILPEDPRLKGETEALRRRVNEAESLSHSLQDANRQLQTGMDAVQGELMSARATVQTNYDLYLEQVQRGNADKISRKDVEKERDEALRSVEVLRSERASLAAPRVVPVRYGKENPAKVWAGIFLSNDGTETAYDVKINEVVIGRASDWKASFSEIPRLAKGEEQISLVQVSGRNVAPNLDWILQMWMNENSVVDDTGKRLPPNPLRISITYRQHGHPDKWYRSNCEIGHDAFQIGKETYVRFLNREEIQQPSSYSAI
jgi:hypothetical protein